MKDWIVELLHRYGDNKLAIAICAALVGVILTKTIPALWSGIKVFAAWVGKLVGGRFAFLAFQQRYLEWVISEHSELKLTGVVTSDDAKKPKLEQVFVSLQVDKRRPSSKGQLTDGSEQAFKLGRSLTWHEIRELLRLQHEKCLPVKSFELERMLSSVKRIRRSLWQKRNIGFYRRSLSLAAIDEEDQAARIGFVDKFFEKFSASDVIAEFQLRMLLRHFERIAILGVPGAGKTTLLQYLAVTHARERVSDPKLRHRGIVRERLGSTNWRLPVFIRLSSIAKLLGDIENNDRDLSILDILPRILPPDLQSNSVATKFFSYHFKKGNCLILLDGLDEVPTDEEFQAVVRAIKSLCLTYGSNKFVVTSRIAGWRSGVDSTFETIYVAELTDNQVETFIDTWYTAVERNAVVGRLQDESISERRGRERRASDRARDLKATLKDNIGIRRLATNPMLLSIIALVHRSLATLPRERSKLYSQCSKILLEQWDISRGIRVDDTGLKLEQKEAVMRRLAYAFHIGEIGDHGGGREASESDVMGVISAILPNLGRPVEDTSHLLQMLVERSGILIERQRGILAFAHHTFQEYFCAQYLAVGESRERQEFLLEHNKLLSDWWREVILLYSGLLSDSSDFIRKILQASAPDLCQQSIRLAALCLGESVEVKDTSLRASVALRAASIRTKNEFSKKSRSLTHDEVDYLVHWAKSQQWYSFAAVALVKAAGQTGDISNLNEMLNSAFADSQSIVRRAVLECIAFVPEKSIGRVQFPIEALNDPDGDVRLSAVRALGEISEGTVDSRGVSHAILTALEANDTNIIEAVIDVILKLQDRLSRLPEAILPILRLIISLKVSHSLIARVVGPLVQKLPEEGGTLLTELMNRDLSLFLLVTSKHRTLPMGINAEILAMKVSVALSSSAAINSRRIMANLAKSNSDICFHPAVVSRLIELLDNGTEGKGALIALSHFVKISAPSERSDEILQRVSSGAKARTLLEVIARSKTNSLNVEMRLKVIEGLSSSDTDSRQWALRAFVNVRNGSEPEAVLESILRGAKDRYSRVRAAAVETLGQLSEHETDSRIAQHIVAALNDRNRKVRISALKTIKHWIPALTNTFEIIAGLRLRLVRITKKRWTVGVLRLLELVFPPEFGRGNSRRKEIRTLIETLAYLGAREKSEEVLRALLDIFKTEVWLSGPFGDRAVYLDSFLLPRYIEVQEVVRQRLLTAYDAIQVDEFFYVGDAYLETFEEATSVEKEHPLETLIRQLPKRAATEALIDSYTSDAIHMKLLILTLLISSSMDIDLDIFQACLTSGMRDKNAAVRTAAVKATQTLFKTKLPATIKTAVLKRLSDDDANIRDQAWEILAAEDEGSTSSRA